MYTRVTMIGGLCLAAAGFAATAQAGVPCTVFFDKPGFEEYCMQHGKILKGIEDFEPPIGDVPTGTIALLTPTLEGNVPNVDPSSGYGFPNGLLNKNLVIQTNPVSPNAPDPAPGGDLVAVGPDTFDPGVPNSIVVGPNWDYDSLDLIFPTGENHTGVGFDVMDPFAPNVVHITVFDKNNAQIAKEIVPVVEHKTFFGIWCPDTIGRINIAAVNIEGHGSFELVDNIQMWMEVQPPVCPWDCAIPHDKMVSVVDFLALLAQWGQVGVPCDFDGGGVGVTDFLKMLAVWGPCPEPPNDECVGQYHIDKVDPQGTAEAHFDMYGATPSPEPYKCLTDEPIHKDIWYCLTNATGQAIGVTITTNIPLFIEVNQGCACPPGPLVACGDGLVGTEQFLMLPEARVLIRLIDWLDLPNEELKGSMFIANKPVETVDFFTDLVLFEEAVFETGKTQKFWWDFSPHDNPTDVPDLEDPVDIKTHGLNPDDPWTDDGGNNLWPPSVNNVQFSSNMTPQGPLTPRGHDGLMLLHPGNWPGVDNNIMAVAYPEDSFDIISGPPAGTNHTAMGFDVISLTPFPSTIHITVYDKADVQMGQLTLDYQGGKAFVGIVTRDPTITIGRVDISDPGNGIEGVSYIQAFWQPVGDVNVFFDQGLFEEAVAAQGLIMKTTWGFKPDHLADPVIVEIDDYQALDINTHPITAPGVWDDGSTNLWPPDVDNVQFSSNINPQDYVTPRGENGLSYVKAGAPPCFLNNNALAPTTNIDSFAVISGTVAGDYHPAIALEVLQLPNLGTPDPIFHISVYDEHWIEFGKLILTGVPAEKLFIGIVTKDPGRPIGGVDVWDAANGFEGISSFAIYARPGLGPTD